MPAQWLWVVNTIPSKNTTTLWTESLSRYSHHQTTPTFLWKTSSFPRAGAPVQDFPLRACWYNQPSLLRLSILTNRVSSPRISRRILPQPPLGFSIYFGFSNWSCRNPIAIDFSLSFLRPTIFFITGKQSITQILDFLKKRQSEISLIVLSCFMLKYQNTLHLKWITTLYSTLISNR